MAQNFSTPYTLSYNFNVQQSFGSKVVTQIGYVGNQSRKLLATVDINQAALQPFGSPSTDAQLLLQQQSRPFFSTFPTYGNINQLETSATGNYNSLQSSVRLVNLHGITTQISYTWSHSLDEVSQSRSALPQDSTNLKGDYGNGAIDTRQHLLNVCHILASRRWQRAEAAAERLAGQLTYQSARGAALYRL